MSPRIIRRAKELGEESVHLNWFEINSEISNKSEFGEIRLPFSRCGVVFVYDTGEDDLFLAVENKGGVDCYFRGVEATFKKRDDGCTLITSSAKLNPEQRDVFSALLKTFINSVNCGISSVFLSRNESKNRRRVAKGKKPLQYEWKTVLIEPKTAIHTSLGGTHASPRRHERRGHWRNLKSGKRVWVRNCWAGNAALGSVFKDYVVKDKYAS